ncbi:MAG: hypothetical protein Q4F55_03715 [Bacillota bacterium]|nr:hypothetical protein [Bacillota bacterium]
MITGFDKFQKAFKDFEDCYTIIGGTACDILMSNADLDFRATKDIDMILILENKYVEFAAAFWNFIKEGKYKCGWKNNPNTHFYRFTNPQPGYPIQIELFSKNNESFKIDSGIIPVHISEDVSSLSAILLNNDFYNFMINGRTTIDGVSILMAEYIIPFKMYAWLNLKEQKASGEHVNDKDLRKHKNDVFRLLQIARTDNVITVTGEVKAAISLFLTRIENEEVDLKQLPFSKAEALEIIKSLYGM